jgi:putative phosphoribosyl transferase
MSADETKCDIPVTGAVLQGELRLPRGYRGIVVFAHGSGSSRHSPRNQWVADFLRDRMLGTLLFDLLSADEERVDAVTAEYRFDIAMLASRLKETADWLAERQGPAEPIGLFGASTGAAAALVAANHTDKPIAAIVSRGGRPDLAGSELDNVDSPTMLIVGARDTQVLALNREAYERMPCARKLVIIDGATHLFEEPGTLAAAATHARDWFLRHLH